MARRCQTLAELWSEASGVRELPGLARGYRERAKKSELSVTPSVIVC